MYDVFAVWRKCMTRRQKRKSRTTEICFSSTVVVGIKEEFKVDVALH